MRTTGVSRSRSRQIQLFETRPQAFTVSFKPIYLYCAAGRADVGRWGKRDGAKNERGWCGAEGMTRVESAGCVQRGVSRSIPLSFSSVSRGVAKYTLETLVDHLRSILFSLSSLEFSPFPSRSFHHRTLSRSLCSRFSRTCLNVVTAFARTHTHARVCTLVRMSHTRLWCECSGVTTLTWTTARRDV